ncbi:hypothetical protein ACLB3A_10905 [Corynebacterium freneyi]|uniref:hypothetical protein n=1 Tax=Corynebacterium freneyi TaxID=134034 RepID=UPI00254ABC52|nr:hypothetical protein [Corynebacterium freneyi]MDK8767789.1 hypothetical protein [Corynebacterium freneyi]
MVAIVGAVALAASLAPVAIAAGLSATKGEEAASLESVRTVSLGGDGAPFAASFDVRDGEPDCTREFALTIGAHQFTCGDVVIETRSAVDVEDLPRFGARALRATLFSDDPAPDLRPAETPRAPGLIAWSGSPVEDVYGTVYRVIVLGEEDGDDEAGDEVGASAIVAIVSGDGDAVDDAAATILADVRAGEE